MTSFSLFPELVPELQMMIWDSALAEEQTGRMVILGREDRRIQPTLHLVSPILSVNHQSRRVAKSFYDVALDVLEGQSQSSQLAGKLYLSFQTDLFCLVYENELNFKFQTMALGPEFAVYLDYFTDPLSIELCARVTSLRETCPHVFNAPM
ncbi:hypothetical protein F4778DRAFT_737998 [Xylariomycetidae sp. FL2044]|nr:hypothetical protein F4778DRAFT_737998 [Xylariomycetidae sp. FL2044]